MNNLYEAPCMNSLRRLRSLRWGFGEAAAVGAGTAAAASATAASTAAATTAATTAAASAAAASTAAATYGGLTAATWLSLVGAAGTGLSTFAALRQLDAQSGMSDLAQKAALSEAASKQDAAAYNERQFRRKASFLMGQQTNIAAASGSALGTGSLLFQELDTARQTELEALNIRRQGDVGAAASRFEAGLAGYRGRYFRGQQAGALAAGGVSILDSWATKKRGGYG